MPQPNILKPGEIEAAARPIPDLLLPGDEIFRVRAARLRKLAGGHALADWLNFVAALADRQQAHRARLADVATPEPETLHLCREHGLPPLSAAGLDRHPVWRTLVRQLAEELAPEAPEPARSVLTRLADAGDAWLEEQAEALLALELTRVDIAASAVVAGALQTYWTVLAGRLGPADVHRPEFPSLCPVCGSHPVASVVHLGGAEHGLRYLACSLCSSQWYLERVKCSNCGNAKGVVYQAVENAHSAVRAESCPECRSYLKILYADKNPAVEPVADDLASVALDWLMSEAGYARSGVNLMLLQGG